MSPSEHPSSLESDKGSPRIWPLALGFFVAALAQRLPFIGFNKAEYTDGILMLGRDVFGATYWPPLYTWACWGLAWASGIDLEIAGQLVSMVGGAAAVVPLVWLAGRFGAGRTPEDRWRLGAFAGALYLASPMAWRWSVRVMSDALFLALFWGALALLEASRGRLAEGKGLDWRFVAANALGTLSALTRHQGVFMGPLALLVASAETWRIKMSPDKPPRRILSVLSILFWVAWPLTQFAQAEAHAGQASYRAGMASGEKTWNAFVALANMTESFVYLSPYFFTPLVALFALIGAIARPRWREGGKTFFWSSLLLVSLVLVSQGFFQSFLSRYLLPLLPIVLILAARGLAWAEDHWPRWLWLASMIAGLAWGVLLGFASLALQREAFGDIKEAARYVRDELPSDLVVYSSEVYKPEADLNAIKTTWWLGREARPLKDIVEKPPPPGSIIIVSSAYGGPESYASQLEGLRGWRGAKVIAEFESTLTPLLPDIMESPERGHQSPLAWVYRYQPQRFRTAVLRLP